MGGIVAAYQPHYYPKLHYLARARQADVFVIYDDVQFSRGSAQHRAPIEYQGKEWLTVPVRHTGVDTSIDEAQIDMSEPWPVSHLRTLVGKYGAAAEELAPFYERLCATIVDVAFLRENAAEVAALVDDPRAGELVDECVRWDAEWRTTKRAVDEVRAEKGRLADRISERKRADPSADIDELVRDAEAVEDRLAELESTCLEAKRRRNRHLVELSAVIDADTPVEEYPMARLWTLDGIDPEELMSDVMLVDLVVPIVEELLRRFDVTSRVVRSSELDVEHADDPSEHLARLTERLGGDCYLSGGVGYDNYFDEDPFDARGFDVLVQDWTPTWEGGNVCALDALFATDTPGRYVE